MDANYGRFEELVWQLNKSFNILWRKNIEQYLPPTQAYILSLLCREGPLKVSSLAEALDITPGAVTMLSDKLLAGGYITRTRDEQDRRVVHLQVTEKGQQILLQFREENMQMIRTIFTGTTPEDVQHLIRIFEQVMSNIEKYKKEMP